ncbi:MAG TPA: creatininase family protein [Rhizobium sp.]|nr:creatininase family protein [Rhizobium sp.]
MLEVEWARMTAPELKSLATRANSLAILPTGALEQHGPHLPVITDTVSASAAAIRAARAVSQEIPVAVLPGLWLGMSEHHFPFGGTISVDHQTYHAIMSSVVRSLRALGFSRLLIVNGHGGNIDALSLSARELAVSFAMPIVATTPWMLARDEVAAIVESKAPGHACEGETSVMMAIAGDLVRSDRFEAAIAQEAPTYNAPPGFSRFYSFSERAPATGTLGDPRRSTKEKGEALLAIHERLLVEAIRNERLWSAPDQVWAPGRGRETTVGVFVNPKEKV